MYLKVLTFPSVLEQGVFGAGGRKLMSHNSGGCGNSFQRRSSSETRRQAECGGGEGQAQELGRVELGLGDRLGLGQGPLARDSSTTGQRRFSQQLRRLSSVSSVLGAGENSPDCTFHSEAKVTTPWECIRYRLWCDDSLQNRMACNHSSGELPSRCQSWGFRQVQGSAREKSAFKDTGVALSCDQYT